MGTCTGVVDGLEPGTEYIFRTCAVSYAGDGCQSSPSKLCVTLGSPTGSIGMIRCVQTTHNVATVEWDLYTAGKNEATITEYRVETSVVNPATGSISDTQVTHNVPGGTATSFQVSSLSPETSYSFRVSAINEIGSGPPSSWSKATTTKGPITEPPSAFSVTTTKRARSAVVVGQAVVVQQKGVKLSWKAPRIGSSVAKMNGYKIFCRKDDVMTYTELVVLGPEASMLEKPLFQEENGAGKFHFYVCATNALGLGPQSTTCTVVLVEEMPLVEGETKNASEAAPFDPSATMAPVAPVAPVAPLAPLDPVGAVEDGPATCVVCGGFVPDGMKFCGNCGTKM